MQARFSPGVRGADIKVSVVIPAQNERGCLPTTLAKLSGQDWVYEVIVVDGGSTDGTRDWLAQQRNVRVLDTPRGKGGQLNAGADAATGDTLLFLHADCSLPRDAGDRIEQALTAEGVSGGCFCVRFAEERPRSLRVVAAGINFRTLVARAATGEQAIFVRRKVFKKIGGFPNWPLFEDVELVKRIKRAGTFKVIRSPVTVSARRHLRCGVFWTVFLVYALRLGYWADISPFTLSRWFDGVRLQSIQESEARPSNKPLRAEETRGD